MKTLHSAARLSKLEQPASKQRHFEFLKTTSKSSEINCKLGILNLINFQQVLNFIFRVKNQPIL